MDIKKVYISGKITGEDIHSVIRKFHDAARKIRRFGFEPVSPLDNGLPFPAAWEDHMGEDVKLLLKSDAIYLLPDYEQSKGARLELTIAKELGMPVFIEMPVAEIRMSGRDLASLIDRIGDSFCKARR